MAKEKPEAGSESLESNEPEAAQDELTEKSGKVYSEELKANYTSHWDWDYLPKAELDRAHAERAGQPDSRNSD